MSNIVICQKCGEKIDKLRTGSILLPNKRYAHVECCEEGEGVYIAPIYSQDYVELEEYIIHLFKLEKMPLRFKNQIKKWEEEEGYTLSGIKKCLEYWFEYQGNPIKESIGIVPWIYDQVKDYYLTIHIAQELNKDKEFKEPSIKKRTIKMDKDEGLIDWEIDLDE